MNAKNMKSLSLPLIGVGYLGYPPQSIKQELEIIGNRLGSKYDVKEISIIVHDDEMYEVRKIV